MPTILRTGQFRFYFYSHDLREPPHVHVDAGEKTAKIWLNPLAIAVNVGFSSVELNRILRITSEHLDGFMRNWNEHFSR